MKPLTKQSTQKLPPVRERVARRIPLNQPRQRVEVSRAQLAEILHALRVRAGITRKELAEETGIRPELIAKLENPEYCRFLPAAEERLQDQLLSFFGAEYNPPPVPYLLPRGWDEALERLRSLKRHKNNPDRQAVSGNFITEDGLNFYDEI